MAAVVISDPDSVRWSIGRPPAAPFHPTRPAVPAGAAAPRRPLPAVVYLRRRLAVLGLLILVVLGALQLTSRPGAVGGTASAGVPAAGRTYVVQPGDTLWSIADRFDPRGDERPLVQALAAELGNRPLLPGQALNIP